MTESSVWEDEEEVRRDEFVPDTLVEAECPHCGAAVVLMLDPGGDAHQEYVEDCQVCCRPWLVHVHFDDTGSATVQLDIE
jgi:hypothetical protein